MIRGVLAFAVLAISWGSILVRLSVSPPLTLAFLRVFFAGVFVAPVALWRRPRDTAPRGAWTGAMGAGLFLALHFATWVTSLSYTSIAASTVLVSTQPVFSAALSMMFLRERPRGRTLAAIVLALTGIVWIAWGDLRAGPGRLTGDLLALLGAVFAAAYLVVGRSQRERSSLPVYFMQVNLWAALGCALLALLGGQPLLPSGRQDLLWCVLMALVPHLIGHGALNWAVRRMRAYIVNLAVLGEPVLASLYGYLIFAEVPPHTVYAGALLIGIGVALALTEASGHRQPRGGL